MTSISTLVGDISRFFIEGMRCIFIPYNDLKVTLLIFIIHKAPKLVLQAIIKILEAVGGSKLRIIGYLLVISFSELGS